MSPTRRVFLLGSVGAAAAGIGFGVRRLGAEEPPLPEEAKPGVRAEAERRFADALPPYAPDKLIAMRDRLAPLHQAAGKPEPGDWLATHPEPGQSFEEYLVSRPTAPTATRRVLEIVPVGATTVSGERLLALTGRYLGHHFGLPVRIAEPIALDFIPRWAERVHHGHEQLHSGYLLEDVLAPRTPDDAAAVLGFLNVDLWPGDGFNFVFGEASLEDRVGVWSLARYGDPDASEPAFRTVLRRALKLAVHEAGHQFSLLHCTAYACVQAGVNSLDEADRAPLWLCPECLAKVAWVTSTDPLVALTAKRDFCAEVGLDAERAFFDRAVALLGSM